MEDHFSSAVRRQKPKCLVVGGSGFLGRHLLGQLIEKGKYDITVFDIKDPVEQRVRFIKGDICQPDEVAKACTGMQVVFHCATCAPLVQNTATETLMHAVNVRGTQNVVDACVRHAVPALVYTSSSTVVFDGRDLVNVDETIPLAAKPIDFYGKTKAEGERIVLAANGRGGLATVALRPSNVYGEHDPLFFPKLIAKAGEGKMKYRIGNGMMTPTYAGNAAHAHVQAAEALKPGSPLAGQAYFISDGENWVFWDFAGDVLEPLGYGRPCIYLPGLLIFILAWVLQWVIIPLMKPFKTIQASEFSPSRIQIVISKRIFSIAKARRDFSYEPQVSTREGLERTLKSFEHLRKPQVGLRR